MFVCNNFFKFFLILFFFLNNNFLSSANNIPLDIKNKIQKDIDSNFNKAKTDFEFIIDLVNSLPEKEFMYEKNKYNLIDDIFPASLNSQDNFNGYNFSRVDLSVVNEYRNTYGEEKQKELGQYVIDKLLSVTDPYKFKCIIDKTEPTLLEEMLGKQQNRSQKFYEYYKLFTKEQKDIFHQKNDSGYNKYMLEIIKKNSLIVSYVIGSVVSTYLCASFVSNFCNTISNNLMKPFFDRWGKHKNFLAKLEFDFIKNYDLKNIAGYTYLKSQFLEIADELIEQKSKLSKIEGICLHGEPGNGKTQIIKALAGQAGIPLVIVNLNTLLNESGQIEENLNLLFAEARKKAPCIILLDEFDLIAGSRKLGKLSDGEKAILNEILQQLDGGKNPLEGVLVVANTNVIANIDFALQRPGRLGRVIEVKAPSKEDMFEIMRLYLTEYKINYDEEFIEFLIAKLISLPIVNVAMIKNYVHKIKIYMKKKKKKKISKNSFELISKNIFA